ncbi:hypothetical protein HanLR1_Chr17g0661221 [Helianthus annuus]|nr:hypothetical protein HanHA89_Chr17g0702531 [Helianthus annuus]KAJ0632095.1 hypothetical protein HanLR1_Chr17g0661221 [Helianthus annuus]
MLCFKEMFQVQYVKVIFNPFGNISSAGWIRSGILVSGQVGWGQNGFRFKHVKFRYKSKWNGLGVAFGSGGSQSLPATEVPGVSSWLVKLCNDSLNKTMVEPRRRCLYLPAVGGVIHVTVVTAGSLSRNSFKGRPRISDDGSVVVAADNHNDTMGKDFHTFVEV